MKIRRILIAMFAITLFSYGGLVILSLAANAQQMLQCKMPDGRWISCPTRPAPRNQVLRRPQVVVAPSLVLGSTARTPVRRGTAQSQNGGCLAGYNFYPDKKECIETHAPRLVQKAQCTVGEQRRVPDPARPGGFRIQECRAIN